MRDDLGQDVGIPHNPKIESPVPVDAGLPLVLSLDVFLRPERTVLEVLKQQQRLLVKSRLNLLWRLFVGPAKVDGKEQPHRARGFVVFRADLAPRLWSAEMNSSWLSNGPYTRPR